MLIQFRFSNFKSFKDDVILDMSADSISEHPDHLIRKGNEKLLPAAGIFGANASGKSNVIKAIRYMKQYVVNSLSFGGNKASIPALHQFIFDKHSRNGNTLFEVFFIDTSSPKEKTYNYGFILNNDGVVEEWLNSKSRTSAKSKLIFYRDDQELDLSGIPEKSRENIRIAIEKETLVVSLGAKLRIEILKMVSDWFARIYIANFGDPSENESLSRRLPLGMEKNESVRKNVVSYLSAFDPSITDFIVTENCINSGEPTYRIDAVHSDKEGNKSCLPLEEESDGTQKMFALYPEMQQVMENGGILVIDELNSRLHPLLVRNFLISFLNPEINNQHAQIIFTSHDVWQLSNNQLRRDEIWFTEKDDNGVSTLYSLSDFQDEEGERIRKDEAYAKNYLVGKYGAIPKLCSFDMFKER